MLIQLTKHVIVYIFLIAYISGMTKEQGLVHIPFKHPALPVGMNGGYSDSCTHGHFL